MPRLFLDACALFKRYIAEAGSDTMRAIVGTAEFRGRLFVCERVHGEVLSALNRAFRRGRLDKKGYREAKREFYSHYPSIFAIVEENDFIRDEAIRILGRHFKQGISHPDATHLAAHIYAASHLPDPNLIMVSSDGSLKEVARLRRIPVFDPEIHPLASIM